MKVVIRWISLVFAGGLLASCSPSGPAELRAENSSSPSPGAAAIQVRVDPRVELMSVVFRLAGSPEYNRGAVPAYTQAVDAHFAPFRRHAAVRRAGRLRRFRGISFNAPMSLAVHLTDPPALDAGVTLDPLPDRIDSRWSSRSARGLVKDLQAFARESEFESFLSDHQELYALTADRLHEAIQDARILEWFQGFFGPRTEEEFIVVAGLLNGGLCYGASARRPGVPDAAEEVYSVLGVWMVDESGLPRFGPEVATTIVHEFAHSYVNPLVDAHARALQPAGQELFGMVRNLMRKQAYASWRTMLYESLVRACEVRYTRAVFGSEAAAREVAEHQSRGFLWTGRLAAFLEEYESDRGAYPTLDAFLPRVVDFFNEYVQSGQAAVDLADLGREVR